jgi:hypothetical protein
VKATIYACVKRWHVVPTEPEFRVIFLGHPHAISLKGRRPWPSMPEKPSDWGVVRPRPQRSSKSWRRASLRDRNSMRMPERIGNPSKPRVVSGRAPIFYLFPHIRHDGGV